MENPTETGDFGRRDFFFFLAAFAFIYTHLFQLPFTPIYYDGDVTHSLSNAMRMLNGEVIYRDFFHFTTPGAELVYSSFFELFGVRVWIPNFVVLVLNIGLTASIWFFSRKIFTGFSVYLPPAIFLVVGFRQFGIDGSNRLFSVLFVMIAVAFLMERRTPFRLAIAGCMCGISTFFVQPRGVVAIAGITAFLIWENYQNGIYLGRLVRIGLVAAASFTATVIITQSYFAWQAGLDNYYFALVGFPANHYGHDPLNNFWAYFSDVPRIAGLTGSDGLVSVSSVYFRTALISVFYYALIPLVYVIFLVHWWRNRQKILLDNHVFPKLVLLSIVGLFLAAGVSAPTAGRLNQVAIPGLVILVWLCQEFGIGSRLTALALILLGLIGISYVIQRQTAQKYFLDMPAGYAGFLYKPTFDKYAWIGANTTPGDVVYEPHHPNYYFPFHLRNPAPLYMARDSDYTPAFQVDAIVTALAKDRPRLIIWPKKWTKTPEERTKDDHLGPLWQFVQANYELKYVLVKSEDTILAAYGDDEVWELKR